ncbi:GatB/YqeY domain-containing protein [Candidatus Gracilibacteria bacterium]|nr:GatB/YqeY domain-containing protein [Candidatus Gracilibacteria bacterium]
MSLLDQIMTDYKQAMMEKIEPKKTTLNMILSKVKYKKIELQKDLEDSDIVQIIKKEIKEIAETIGFLEKANKVDDLELEKQKKMLLELYLPATMSQEQTKDLIDSLIQELNITELAKQRGILMKELMAKYKGQIDGSLVNEIINSMLT